MAATDECRGTRRNKAALMVQDFRFLEESCYILKHGGGHGLFKLIQVEKMRQRAVSRRVKMVASNSSKNVYVPFSLIVLAEFKYAQSLKEETSKKMKDLDDILIKAKKMDGFDDEAGLLTKETQEAQA
nr:hypothetical protein [Tanacetum cinerariifolium]